MRRDYFTLEVTGVEGEGVPTVHIDFEGPSERLVGRLTDDDGEPLDADEIDVAYRLRAEEGGVVGVTNRVTGEFILELNAASEDVLEFIRAASEYGGDDEQRYRIVVSTDGDEFLTHDKRTFLVYDADGDLRRSDSLIPSGVEL